MRQMAQRSRQKTRKKKAPARPRRAADKTAGVRGARINQLFQDALRDLEALKQPSRRRGRA
jgi:hypothetical protein